MSQSLLVRDAESNKAYVRTADLGEIPALAKLLRRAFINDPMVNYIANLEEVRRLFLHLDLAQFAGSLFKMTPKRLDLAYLRLPTHGVDHSDVFWRTKHGCDPKVVRRRRDSL